MSHFTWNNAIQRRKGSGWRKFLQRIDGKPSVRDQKSAAPRAGGDEEKAAESKVQCFQSSRSGLWLLEVLLLLLRLRRRDFLPRRRTPKVQNIAYLIKGAEDIAVR